METIGSKRSYALTWCMPNNDVDDDVCLNVYNVLVYCIALSLFYLLVWQLYRFYCSCYVLC